MELEELFVEGLVHVSTLDDDLYTFVENRHSLVGRNRGRVLRIGDRARVRVASVSPATRRIEFVLVGHVSSTPQTPLTTAGNGEFPRIPIRGKRLPGQSSRKDTEGTQPGPAASRREGRKGAKKGAVRTGGRKRR